MNSMNAVGSLCVSSALLWCVAVDTEEHTNLVSSQDRYDPRRVMHLSAAELAAEERGKVHIYDSLEINEVNAAFDENFERITT